MAWDRQALKYWIKDRRLLDRNVNDGRLDDARIEDAIDDAMETVTLACNLLGERRTFAIRANQWEYPMPDDVNDIRAVWYIDSGGTKIPLTYMSNQQFLNWRDPADDQSSQVNYFSYPHMQGRVLSFKADALPVYDYVTESWVTSATIRTIVDTGINFGLTLSGDRVTPGNIAVNLTDYGSVGYVEVLDTNTNTSTGTTTSGTNTNTLKDSGATFITDGVAIGDIICTPSTGVVTSYGFVTEIVSETELTYDDFQSSGTTVRFSSGDTYKVGKAQKIRLDTSTPHPGLRDGAANVFTVSGIKATITSATFTSTTVTGSSTSGAEEGDIAIASGGAHGYISSVSANQLTVDKWIGGTPTDGQTITVKECDKYQIQTDFRLEKVMWLGPTPSADDTVGEESIEILCNTRPVLPVRDTDPIEIPIRYQEALQACLEWKAAERAGDETPKVDQLQAKYHIIVRRFQGDVYRPPVDAPMSPWLNRKYSGGSRGVRHMTPSGVKYDVSGWL